MDTLRATTSAGNGTVLSGEALQALAGRLRGPLIRPHDANYDAARRVWNGMIDKRPALIARCSGTADVIDAVNFARENDLLVAVRGGGHSVAGHAVCDGGLVIDLSEMRGVRVDPTARTARAQGGATWGDLDRETQAFGLATPGGVVSTTGIAGLTLSGGYSWQRRKHGMSIDNLLSADVVTADGELLHASEDENQDLFWAIRGGGGSFGVVTSFEYRLHELGPEVMFLACMYPLRQIRNVMGAWRDFIDGASDETTVDCIVWGIPAHPAFPENVHGQAVVVLAGMYAGPAEEGKRVLQPLRELGTPVLDLSGIMPYTDAQQAFDPFFPSGELLHYWKSLYLNSMSDEVIEAVATWGRERPESRILFSIRHLEGAIRRVPADATAFGDRSAPFLLSIDATWEEAEDSEENIAWSRRCWSDMQRFSPGGTYFNFPGFLEEGEDLLRASYGENYDRLVEIKTKYDPDNLFRLNQNIAPAG